MLKFVSGLNRTPRLESTPRVRQARTEYEQIARDALFRAQPSMENLALDIAILDATDSLELFWELTNLGGPMPGGWHQVTDLKLVFECEGLESLTVPLTNHIAGFHAWYRMRGGMPAILPLSHYFNLSAGAWDVYVEGQLEDVEHLCRFADSFDDLFHEQHIRKYYDPVREQLRSDHLAATEMKDTLAAFRLSAGQLVVPEGRTTKICDRQANRLHQIAVNFADVANLPAPEIEVPEATPLDPLHFFNEELFRQHKQSLQYNFCPYNTVNYWDDPPVFEREHFYVSDRTAYFHIESLAPLFRVTGDPEVYRTTRKWYETIIRNIWPMPGGGQTMVCGGRTVYGTALHNGGIGDAMCTFAEIDGESKWLEPVRDCLLDWPMHSELPRPIMDQDMWGNEEMNTTGTYNMCTHYALALWRVGYMTSCQELIERAERILNDYTFKGHKNGIWPYRDGNYPSHHYDMYLKWQLSRLLLTGAERWTGDEAFVQLLVQGTESSIREYAEETDDELVFSAWTHKPEVTHPANAARHGTQQLEVMMALALYADEGFIEPMEKTLRALYRLLKDPAVDRCWHGSWFHVHGNLLALALHGFHVEGNDPSEMRVVKR